MLIFGGEDPLRTKWIHILFKVDGHLASTILNRRLIYFPLPMPGPCPLPIGNCIKNINTEVSEVINPMNNSESQEYCYQSLFYIFW